MAIKKTKSLTNTDIKVLNHAVDLAIAGKLDEAEKDFLKLYKKYPENYKILGNLGKLYLEKNQFSKAKKFLDDSLKIEPKDPVTWANKGSLEANIGNHTKAIEFFDKALKIEPKDEFTLLEKANSLYVIKEKPEKH